MEPVHDRDLCHERVKPFEQKQNEKNATPP